MSGLCLLKGRIAVEGLAVLTSSNGKRHFKGYWVPQSRLNIGLWAHVWAAQTFGSTEEFNDPPRQNSVGLSRRSLHSPSSLEWQCFLRSASIQISIGWSIPRIVTQPKAKTRVIGSFTIVPFRISYFAPYREFVAWLAQFQPEAQHSLAPNDSKASRGCTAVSSISLFDSLSLSAQTFPLCNLQTQNSKLGIHNIYKCYYGHFWVIVPCFYFLIYSIVIPAKSWITDKLCFTL